MARVLVNIRKKLLGGISIPTSYRSTSYRRFATPLYTLQPMLGSRAPTSPIIPEWHVGDFYTCPHLQPEIFDKIRDESLQAVCCFHGRLDYGYKHAYVIIQKLLEQYPHVQAYHFLITYDFEKDTPLEVEMRGSNVSSLPMFHFYQHGKKVVELDGYYIIRFKKVLQKLYKPHNRESNLHFFGVSTSGIFQGIRQYFHRLFSISAQTHVYNQQSSRDSIFSKIQGRAGFELILSEEYILDENRIEDMPTVVCYATYLDYSSLLVYQLLHDTFSKRFPHVLIYYVLLAPKEDDYGTTLENINIRSADLPTIRFYKDGENVALLVSRIDHIEQYCRDLENMFEDIYNTEQDKDGEGFRGQQGMKVKELDCSASLEDIIKDAGIVHSGDLNMNSNAQRRGQQGMVVKELDCSASLEDIIKDAGIVHSGDLNMNSNAQRRRQSPSAPDKGDIMQKLWMIWQQIPDGYRKLWQ